MKLTKEQIAEIQARADKASPAPWKWSLGEFGGQHIYCPPGTPDNPYPEVLSDGSAGGEYNQDIKPESPDGIFVENSRTDIPTLLAHITEVERERDLLREQCRVGDVAFQHLFTSTKGMPVPDWVKDGLPNLYTTLSTIEKLRGDAT